MSSAEFGLDQKDPGRVFLNFAKYPQSLSAVPLKEIFGIT
jgi:hypothetical protein